MKRVRKLYRILKYLFTNKKYFTLSLLKAEAEDHLDTYYKIGVGNVEDIEDLIFHIDSYMEIPQVLQTTVFKGYLEKGEKLDEYFVELEKMRAVERDYIFELAKKLPIGFEL